MKKILLLTILFLSFTSVARANITSNMEQYFNYDQNGGTSPLDSSGNGRDGDFAGSGTTPAWVPAYINSGLQFLGGFVDGHANGAFDVGTGDFTVAFWYKSPGAAVIECPFSKDDGSGNGLVIYFFNSGNIQTYVANGVGVNWLGTINDDVWHHWVLRRTSGTIELFEDGVSLGTVSRGSDIGTQNIRWGIEDGSDWPAVGIMDESRYYSRALSDADVAELYAFTGGGGPTPEEPAIDYLLNWFQLL